MGMRSLLLVAPLSCLLLACAKGEAIPQCAGAAPPKVEAACLAQSDAKLFREDVARVLQPAAGSTLVRVDLPASGGPAALCSGRPSTRSDWRDRVSVAAAAKELPALGEAPACMAGRSFEVNQFVARRAVIRQEIVVCQRHAERNREHGIGFTGQDLQRCISELQNEADELWYFSEGQSNPVPFMRARADADRKAAMRNCDTRDADSKASAGAADLLTCLAEEGWVPYQ